MNMGANHKRYSTRELEAASVKFCPDCPLPDCKGGARCAYLRNRMAGMSREAALEQMTKAAPKKAERSTCTRPARPPRLYEHDGKFYTLREIAEMCGASYEAVKSRFKYGWTVEEVLQNHRNKPCEGRERARLVQRTYTYNGEEYTVAQLAKQCGKSCTAVYERIYKGWTIEEIVQNARDDRVRRISGEDGREYTYKDLAEACGRTIETVRVRIWHGWTVEEVLQNHREGRKKQRRPETT